MKNRFQQLSKKRENGRVQILNMKGSNKYQLFQQKTNGNNIYRKEAVNKIHSENPLNQAYFSQQNIEIIQNSIKYAVYIQSKYKIGRQSNIQLKIIMRSIYLQYGQNLCYDIRKQITKLNKLVIDYSVKQIISNILQYIGYKKDVSTIPTPMARPKYLSSAGTKTLQPNHFF